MNKEPQVVRGRVAMVLDEKQIAINVGYDEGVAEGDKVQLLRAVDVPDPLNEGAVLGTAYVKKGLLIVDSVDEKFCVARVAKGKKGASGTAALFAPLEPLFVITTRRSEDGPGRVYVQPSDYVDITLTAEDEEF